MKPTPLTLRKKLAFLKTSAQISTLRKFGYKLEMGAKS